MSSSGRADEDDTVLQPEHTNLLAVLGEGSSPGRHAKPKCDIAKLRASFGQLVAGVRAIHSVGKLHRDLKPSNVYVTRSGRVVILDFGISVDLGQHESAQTDVNVAGTPKYMAPEQATGGSLSEASDWYSAGVILFEALTGSMPPPMSNAELLPRPSDFCPSVPEDLDLLCRDLLPFRPDERLNGDKIVRRLGMPELRPSLSSVTTPHSFCIGREEPLAALEAAFTWTLDHGPAIAHIEGRSGMGKTALLENFLAGGEGRTGTVVLSGRCNPEESVPYKALDTLVDSLTRYMRKLDHGEIAELLPRNVWPLAQMFPTLLRVPAIAKAPRVKTVKQDAIECRQMASAGLRELLSRLTDRRRLILAVDDLQWGDLDSAILLAELLSPPDPPPLLLIVASRPEDEESGVCLPYLKRGSDSRRWFSIKLEPLTAENVQEMSARMGDRQQAISKDMARKIALESDGNPLFIQEFLSDQTVLAGQSASVDDLIWARILRNDRAARVLLEVVSASGRPLDLQLAFQAADLGEDSLHVYTGLRNARLLRRVGMAEPERVETYHDRIRETITARIDSETLRGHHHQLALALQSTPTADPEHAGFHLERSGEHRLAGEYYKRAADRAAAALAFEQASALYTRALRLSGAQGDERRHLQKKLARAVANAGRSYQAAQLFEEAAREARGDDLIELKQRAAYYYCISGRIEEGKRAFRSVLYGVQLRLPSSYRKAILALVGARIKLAIRGLEFRKRSWAELEPSERARIDAAWAAATGLGMVDLADAAYFSTQSVILALDAGEPCRIARSLAWEAATSSYFGAAGRKRAEKLFLVCERLAQDTADPYVRGLLSLSRGISAYSEGLWNRARTLMEEAEAVLSNECTGVAWELATTRVFSQAVLIHVGDYAVMQQQCPEIIRNARERGDLFTEVLVGATSQASLYCALDQPDRARKLVDDLLATWSRDSMDTPQFVAMLTSWFVRLYSGEFEGLWPRFESEWRKATEAGMFRGEYNRVMSLWMRASIAISIAQTSSQPQKYLKEAERTVKQLGRETMIPARPLASAMQSAIWFARGDRKATASCLEKTAEQAEASDMLVILNCARFLRGQSVDDSFGNEAKATAEAWMRSHGIVNPARFACANIPIFVNATSNSGAR